jgi:hypothetical protein
MSTLKKITTLTKPTLSKVSELATAFAEAGAKPTEATRIFHAPEGYRRLTINVTHELHKKLRLMAVEQDTTITDILTSLVAKELG